MMHSSLGTCLRKIHYSHLANAFYTYSKDGIPEIPSPKENQYAFFSLMRLDDISLDALLSRFGDRYTTRKNNGEDLYVYDFGLVIRTAGDGKVTTVYLGDDSFSPAGHMKKKADLLEDEGEETAVLYAWNIYYGLYIENGKKGSYVNAILDFMNVHEWELADLAGDGRPEIYIAGNGAGVSFQKLYTLKNGRLVELFNSMNEMEHTGRVSCDLKGKELTVTVKGYGTDKDMKMSCILPDRLFPKEGGLNDSHALYVSSGWKPAERSGQKLIRLTCTVQKKAGTYYFGPLFDADDGFEFPDAYVADMFVDVAWVTFWLKHNGSNWQVVDTQLSMKYRDGTGETAPPITYEENSLGPVSLGMPIREAIRALGGNPDDYSPKELESGRITMDGVILWSDYYSVERIILTPESRFATKRGVKVGDSAETLERAYGKPDGGRFEDGLVFWYFTRADGKPDFGMKMTVTLENGKVSSIELYEYLGD